MVYGLFNLARLLLLPQETSWDIIYQNKDEIINIDTIGIPRGPKYYLYPRVGV